MRLSEGAKTVGPVLNYRTWRRCFTLTLTRDTDLVHTAIALLTPGDCLQVRAGSGRWELLDRNGTVVGQLARGFEPPSGMRCAFATVTAVIRWDRARSEPQFQASLRCTTWEVVVPELVFEFQHL